MSAPMPPDDSQMATYDSGAPTVPVKVPEEIPASQAPEELATVKLQGQRAAPDTTLPVLVARLPRALFVVIGVLVVVALGVAIVVPRTHQQRPKTVIRSNAMAYTASAPGPNCDKNGANWQIPLNPQMSAVCQGDSLALTQKGDFTTLDEVFFQGLSATFPQSYQVQVHANITAGDDFTSVGFEVHRQLPLGGQVHMVSANGAWQVDRVASNGKDDTRLALGFLPAGSKSLDLSIQVLGPVMTFAIGGKTITTVTDSTFATTSAIALVLDNPGATKPISAVFSQFAYKPLATPTTVSAQSIATATAQAVAASQTTYTAAVPGFGCDKGAGVWAPSTLYGDTSNDLKCASNGLEIDQSATAATAGEARFFGVNGVLANNYRISANIDLSGLHYGCAGFITRTDAAQGGYSFILCANGGWSIDLITDQGTQTALADGAVGPLTAGVLAATVSGSNLTLSLNGAVQKTVQDTTYGTTNYISLIAQTPQNVLGTAFFSNFTFAPNAA